MNEMFAKYANPSCWMFLASRKTSAHTTSTASTGRRYDDHERRALREVCAVASAATVCEYAPGEASPPPAQIARSLPPLPDEVGARRDRLHRDELLPGLA